MDNDRPMARVLTGTVSAGRVRAGDEELAKRVTEILTKAGFLTVRHVVVKGEPHHLQMLVQNVSNDNEADAILLLGGAGFGPKDNTCEALNELFEKRIEGFAEAYRRLLLEHHGVHSMLSRATAGVFNQCTVFALAGIADDVETAVRLLIAPVLTEATNLAYGRPVPARR